MKRRTKRQRSEAAKRGWITRRKNERRREREAAERRQRRRDRRERREKIAALQRRKERAERRPTPTPTPTPTTPEYEEPIDDFPSEEWEVGFEYHSGGNRASFVDVNIRIAREDGRQFGKREASRVFREFREHLSRTGVPEIPAGYMMAFIEWHRPRWGSTWQAGDEVDLGAFRNLMLVEADNDNAWDVRLGSVK